jgi:hypothetical protein
MPRKRISRSLKLSLVAILLLFVSLFIYITLEAGRSGAQTAMLLEPLNPAGEMVGPQSIQFDSAGNIYIGDTQGIIWKSEQGGSPVAWTKLDQSLHTAVGDINVSGLVFDASGNLYCSTSDYAGGTILRIDSGTKSVHIFASGIGIAKGLAIASDQHHLWAVDHRFEGRILRFPLDAPQPAQADLIVKDVSYPEGLAFGQDDKSLYVCETFSGKVLRLDLTADQPRPQQLISLRGFLALGSLEGLAFDPRDRERRFLYVAENLRGLITIIDLQSQPPRVIKQISLAQIGGRPCPTSMEIRDGYLYFTDIWTCSPLRLLFRIPKWRNHAYRFRIVDLTRLF